MHHMAWVPQFLFNLSFSEDILFPNAQFHGNTCSGPCLHPWSWNLPWGSFLWVICQIYHHVAFLCIHHDSGFDSLAGNHLYFLGIHADIPDHVPGAGLFLHGLALFLWGRSGVCKAFV